MKMRYCGGAEMTVQVQMWCHEALFVSKQVDRAGMHMGRRFGVFSEPARLNAGEVWDILIQGEVAGQRWWGQGEARTGGWVGPEARGRPGRRQHLGHISSKQVQHGPSLAVNVQCSDCVLGGLPAAVDAEARRGYAPPGRAC